MPERPAAGRVRRHNGVDAVEAVLGHHIDGLQADGLGVDGLAGRNGLDRDERP